MKRPALTFFCIFIAICLPKNAFSDADSSRILYLIQTGNLHTALNLYHKKKSNQALHDRDLLRRMGLAILDLGYRFGSVEEQVMTLFGAGIAASDQALYILEDGIKSENPQIQLLCLNHLGRYQDAKSDDALRQALSSSHLLIRLEALYYLCKKKSPLALSQAEALMCKTPSEALFVFPQFFAMIGTPAAINVMNQQMCSPSEKVRLEAILSAAKYSCDLLIPAIRMLVTQSGVMQQEAAVYALGEFKDEPSFAKIKSLASSASDHLRLASLLSLYKLGRQDAVEEIKKLALKQDLFAIAALSSLPETEETLAFLAKSSNIHVKANASIALLEKKDARAAPGIIELLIKDPRDLALTKISSPGKSLNAWRVIPSSSHQYENDPVSSEMSLTLKEEILKKTANLPEGEFLKIAVEIFNTRQNALVPTLVDLLQTLGTKESIALLKKYKEMPGSPLIRNYCLLALYRMDEEGPYGERLKKIVSQQIGEDLLRFRPVIPRSLSNIDSDYHLTPEETSKLLIQAFEVFSARQEELGIDVLLEAIQNGNKMNKYALAGLLIRAAH